jgi:hypothetical protein
MKGRKILTNTEVHAIGVAAMYLATKYEDVYPFSSFIAYERISHKAVSQKEILRLEGEFFWLCDFDLQTVTPFDFHEYITGAIDESLIGLFHPENDQASDMRSLLAKLSELSLYIIRQSIENHSDFSTLTPSFLTASALHAALNLLYKHKHMND